MEILSENEQAPTEIELETEEDAGLQQQEKISPAVRIAPYQFKKGQSGNPAGRPPGKSLKERAKSMLQAMTEEEEQEFLQGINKRVIWEMAEGKAKQDVEANITHNIAGVLDSLEHDETLSGQEALGQAVADVPLIQDPQQATELSPVQAEPSAGALQPEQMVAEHNSEVPPVGVHD